MSHIYAYFRFRKLANRDEELKLRGIKLQMALSGEFSLPALQANFSFCVGYSIRSGVKETATKEI